MARKNWHAIARERGHKLPIFLITMSDQGAVGELMAERLHEYFLREGEQEPNRITLAEFMAELRDRRGLEVEFQAFARRMGVPLLRFEFSGHSLMLSKRRGVPQSTIDRDKRPWLKRSSLEVGDVRRYKGVRWVVVCNFTRPHAEDVSDGGSGSADDRVDCTFVMAPVAAFASETKPKSVDPLAIAAPALSGDTRSDPDDLGDLEARDPFLQDGRGSEE